MAYCLNIPGPTTFPFFAVQKKGALLECFSDSHFVDDCSVLQNIYLAHSRLDKNLSASLSCIRAYISKYPIFLPLGSHGMKCQ
jgi:hypothetical protein